MASQDSSAQVSRAFDLYDPRVQRWIWRQGWSELRDIQEKSAEPIFDGRDVLISSATASGKTEAAFLPICSSLGDDAKASMGVIYIAPLKALINDQHHRLTDLFECIDALVTPWHGDISAAIKRRFVNRPRGALLITPESIEALFVRSGSSVPDLVKALKFIVVDELHAFIGTERGRQLQTLMHRLEVVTGRRIARIGLSATLGEPWTAARFLRPQGGENVVCVTSSTLGREVRLQVRGYLTGANDAKEDPISTQSDTDAATAEYFDQATGDDVDISKHIFKTLRGSTNLVFANQRVRVEQFSDLLRRHSARLKVPNEFWPHHGNLSREIRQDVEERLRSRSPNTVVATTTLELGIDIGAVDSIAQIGPPNSVASIKQRLGRSGRKPSSPSVIRIYVQEPKVDENTSLIDQLRVSLVQTIAMIELLRKGWVEAPPSTALHLSTLVQQLLSLTAQNGGFRAADAYHLLCTSGPFDLIDRSTFAQLLRDMASHQLLNQTHDGIIVLDLAGERLVNHHDFYAAFTTPDEWRLIAGSEVLGTMPVNIPLVTGSFLIFAGRRWRIVAVNDDRHELQLESAVGGRLPNFRGTGALIHDQVRKQMHEVYAGKDSPIYLDAIGRDLLEEARDTFRRMNLAETKILRQGIDTFLFPWVGDRALNTLVLQLRFQGLDAVINQPAIVLNKIRPEQARQQIAHLAQVGPPDVETLSASVENKHSEKHHRYLSEPLLIADYAFSQLDADGAWTAARQLSG